VNKRTNWAIALAIATNLCALSDRASAIPGDARIKAYELNVAGDFNAMPLDDTIANERSPYSLAEHYEVGGAHFLILVTGANGFYRVLQIDAGVTGLTEVERGTLGGTGWRGIGVAEDAGQPYLYLAKPADGRVVRYPVLAGGQIDKASRTTFTNFPDLDGRTRFDVFTQATPRLFIGDTFGPQASVTDLAAPNARLGTAAIGMGWSNVDHLAAAGRTFRLLYKEAGDPMKAAGSAPLHEGRARIERLGPNGFGNAPFWEDILLSGRDAARFVRTSSTTYRFVTYDRLEGVASSYLFDPFAPESTGTAATAAMLETGFDEVLSFFSNGRGYVIGVELDEDVDVALRLTGDQMGRLAECVHDNLAHRTGGYQLSVAQNGKVLMSRASGLKRLVGGASPLDRDDRMAIGSVSKVITSITAMRVGEEGALLGNAIGPQLDGNVYPEDDLDPWTQVRNVYDLMAHTTGFPRTSSGLCSAEDNLTTDCTPLFMSPPPNACVGPSVLPNLGCPRDYSNANTVAMREFIEAATGSETSVDIVNATQNLWLDAVMNDGPTCQGDPNATLFGLCSEGLVCNTTGLQSFCETFMSYGDDNYTRNCSAGGWRASTDDLVSVYEALEAEGILSNASTNTFLRTDLLDSDGAATALGFEPPYTSRNVGASVLGKNGGLGEVTGLSSFATLLDGHAQAALTINTKRGAPDADALFKYAYGYAVGDRAECIPDLTLAERHDVTLFGQGTDVELTSVDNGTVVVAVESAPNVKLVSMQRNGWALDEVSSRVEMWTSKPQIANVGSNRVVLATRNLANNLVLRLYDVQADGTLTPLDNHAAGAIQDHAIVKLSGAQPADFVTVTRTQLGQLHVAVWAILPGGTIASRGGYISPEGILEVSAVDGLGDRIVVTVRTDDLKVKPIVFDVTNNAWTVNRRGEPDPMDLEIGWHVQTTRIEDGAATYFMSVFANEDGNLRMVAWDVSGDGMTLTKAFARTSGGIASVGSQPSAVQAPYLVVPVTLAADDKARFLGFEYGAGQLRQTARVGDSPSFETALTYQSVGGTHWAIGAYATLGGAVHVVSFEAIAGL
jgi:hypothetical protein